MKKKTTTIPAVSKLNLLRQIGNLIPEFLVPKLARQTGAAEKARTFKPWSHVLALMYAQLTHSIGLNDVCDALSLHSGPLSSIRGATPPNRNTLSHANKVRPKELFGHLGWAVLDHLGQRSPRFVSGKAGKRFARKFRRTIHLVDSTTIPLIASCMDWAKHRRRKAAAKCHLRLDLQSFLPRFALVDTARHNDAKRARELCAGIKAGEIVIFDKAYVDFAHLADLSQREVFWVTRAKDNLSFRVVRKFQDGACGKILRDDLIQLQAPASLQDYPVVLRRNRGHGRGGRQGSGKGISDQQPGGERPEHRVVVSLALAGVDSTAGLLAVALPGVSLGVEPQLQPAIHVAARGAVEKVGPAEFAAALWDSRRPVPLLGPARTGLSAGLGLNLWDSPLNQNDSSRMCYVISS